MKQAGRADLVRVRRLKHEAMSLSDRVIMVRDQAPLHRGNLSLPAGYTFEDFIESLNQRVFFWPGGDSGPISYGIRHFERYRDEKPAILRVNFESLIGANPIATAGYCQYNSGSPRCSYGDKSPRGPSTFLNAADFDGTPSKVVEVTFDCEVKLPKDTLVGNDPRGPWRLLFETKK